MTPLRVWPGASFVLAAVAVLALLASCSGDADAEPTVEASAAPFRVRPLSELSGYRFTVEIVMLPQALARANDLPPGLLGPDDDVSLHLEGTYVAPDREHSVTSFSLGDLMLLSETIRVGERRWSRDGEGPWREGAASEVNPILASRQYHPATIFAVGDDFSLEALSERLDAYPYTVEVVNGYTSRHYPMTSEEFEIVFQTGRQVLPPEAGSDASWVADIWIAEEQGTPVRLRMIGHNAQGQEILRVDMDMSDLGATNLVVEPPS